MWTALIGVFGNIVGGITKNLPTIAAYFSGRKAATADQQKKALKIKEQGEKIKQKNKDLSDAALLKKAKKYRRDD
jgi:hypothetical protein